MEDVVFDLNEEIDYSKFEVTYDILGLVVEMKNIGRMMGELKEFVLNEPKVKKVYEIDDEEKRKTHKVIALDKNIKEDTVADGLREVVEKHGLEFRKISVKKDQRVLNYREILGEMLPEGITVPSGYEVIGGIAHFNLKKPQFPYKYVIGRVILDKDNSVRTVVNKTEKLSNVYRTPILELIAGAKNYETIHLEGNLKFKLDFEKVYWCSRLHAERDRVLKNLKGGEIICDAFCGIGPFALRAAKEANCKVYASDLNPECFKYLKENIAINKLQTRVIPSCADARDYIQKTMLKSYKGQIESIDHYYMNLPADALEFLDAFVNFFKAHPGYLGEEAKFQRSLVHVYCFVKKSDAEGRLSQVVERVSKVMPRIAKEDVVEIHSLKTVSSEKEMLCVTLRLSRVNCRDTELKKRSKKVEEGGV